MPVVMRGSWLVFAVLIGSPSFASAQAHSADSVQGTFVLQAFTHDSSGQSRSIMRLWLVLLDGPIPEEIATRLRPTEGNKPTAPAPDHGACWRLETSDTSLGGMMQKGVHTQWQLRGDTLLVPMWQFSDGGFDLRLLRQGNAVTGQEISWGPLRHGMGPTTDSIIGTRIGTADPQRCLN